DRDMELISVICCLKNTGMPIKQIKEYINWCVVGDETLDMRKELFIKHRQDVLRQIEELNTNLEKIDYKIKYYGNKSKMLCFGEEKEEEQK
ncbi:MAG: MerR family transcriptional regulator, partial [Cetobacterium sp.]